MMRAVGARKGFISRMFLAETFSLSFVFGGEIFRPALGAAGLTIGILGLGLVTLLAVVYPVIVARKITPLDAINRH